jgi:hypothetical protein
MSCSWLQSWSWLHGATRQSVKVPTIHPRLKLVGPTFSVVVHRRSPDLPHVSNGTASSPYLFSCVIAGDGSTSIHV